MRSTSFCKSPVKVSSSHISPNPKPEAWISAGDQPLLIATAAITFLGWSGIGR